MLCLFSLLKVFINTLLVVLTIWGDGLAHPFCVERETGRIRLRTQIQLAWGQHPNALCGLDNGKRVL